jgi:hypothetical protein
MAKKIHAVGGYPPGPGQTITNGTWGSPSGADVPSGPPASPASSTQSGPVFGKRVTPPPVKAAGGYPGANLGKVGKAQSSQSATDNGPKMHAAGGAVPASGLDGALMAHADKMHPVRR